MWRKDRFGEPEFTGGKDSWVVAAKLAKDCPAYIEDLEEELVADDNYSCYNCRFRRWTENSFVCKVPFRKNKLNDINI